MNSFLIYYGGDACIEVLSYMIDAKICNTYDKFYIIDKSIKRQNKNNLKNIYKKISFFKNINNIRKIRFSGVYITSGQPKLREKALNEIKKNKFKLSTLVHPTSYISKSAKIFPGSILAPFTLVAPYVIIMPNCFLNSYSSIGHHSTIGKSNVLSPYSVINGNCKIDNANLFGSGAIVNPNIKIGNNCKVSSNSVLRKSMKNNCIAHGNPAIIKKIY